MPCRPIRLALVGATLAAMFWPPCPALAITGGQRDEVHTNVGLVRFTTPDGRFRCSGTLIAPTVVLTAGHCTEGPATNVYVSFNTDLALDPLAPGITAEERAARAANYITGTAHPDPAWDGKLQFSKQHDQGVVVLDAPARQQVAGHRPGAAAAGRFPRWQPGPAEERDVHPGRLRGRHRRQEGD